MELKKIKELMTAMGRTGIKRLAIKDGEFEIELEREGSVLGKAEEPHSVVHVAAQSLIRDIPPSLSHPVVEKHEEEKVDGAYITSPMVGTFYGSPSPDDPPFIKPGDKISEDTVVCVIEAMKVMNEVKAGISGTVAEVHVENSHPVEFGTKLFRVV